MRKPPSALRRFVWSILGKPLEAQAAEYGVPLEDRRFWPAFYCFDRTSLPRAWVVNKMICPELYGAKIGDVVPVFADASNRYVYAVLGKSWAAGDDHIVSPAQFHIKFVRAEPLEGGNAKE